MMYTVENHSFYKAQAATLMSPAEQKDKSEKEAEFFGKKDDAEDDCEDKGEKEGKPTATKATKGGRGRGRGCGGTKVAAKGRGSATTGAGEAARESLLARLAALGDEASPVDSASEKE